MKPFSCWPPCRSASSAIPAAASLAFNPPLPCGAGYRQPKGAPPVCQPPPNRRAMAPLRDRQGGNAQSSATPSTRPKSCVLAAAVALYVHLDSTREHHPGHRPPSARALRRRCLRHQREPPPSPLPCSPSTPLPTQHPSRARTPCEGPAALMRPSAMAGASHQLGCGDAQRHDQCPSYRQPHGERHPPVVV